MRVNVRIWPSGAPSPNRVIVQPMIAEPAPISTPNFSASTSGRRIVAVEDFPAARNTTNFASISGGHRRKKVVSPVTNTHEEDY
jgi:hypothetical protein